MQLHSLPNDILQNIDPITLILLIPLLDRLIYPFIRTRLNIAFRPLTRITWGFMFASLAMCYAAILQSKIYGSAPCYDSPSNCAAGKIPGTEKHRPNEVHVAWQAPAYVLVALSEVLASVTGLELAYAKAPANMKSFIMALFLLTSAGGSALGVLIAPWARDPGLVWFYAGLACLSFAAGFLFYWCFGRAEGVDMEERRNAKTVESAVEDEDEGIEMMSRRRNPEDDRSGEV
jgi:dipeptide/tripeptide permease